jgi:hypothetical protein
MRSGLQQLNFGGGQSQQSSRALPPHRLEPSLRPQMLPRGWQPVGLRQVPSGGETALSIVQVTLPAPSVDAVGSPPQQSAFFWQRSFVRRQPLAGWQIFTPDCAKGAHWRLQQLVQPAHTIPSWMQLPAPVVATAWQTPAAAPFAFWQLPVQQSSGR